MKSPITGKEMELRHEHRSLEFRKESFEILFHYYKCVDSGEQFTTTELDELNMNQLYNQYRYKYNIPFAEEIAEVRTKYGVAASTMSEILGFGVNTYRNYEAGEIPANANAKLIQMADDPKQFKKLVEINKNIALNQRIKINHRIEQLLSEHRHQHYDSNVQQYLFGMANGGKYTGYRKPDVHKLTHMVMFFAEKMKPFKTKMNKLLFYADFFNFRRTAFSISGMQYVAINHGPVPNNFQSIFEYLANEGYIDRNITMFPSGYEGTVFTASSKHQFDKSLFAESELTVLNDVATIFKDTSTNEIIELSHLEQAWIDNEGDKAIINYEYAFEILL